MRDLMRTVFAVLVLGLIPSTTAAQQSFGSIAGQVRDTSAGVLPGVTVEVSGPALIEKTRSVVTDGNGAYQASLALDINQGGWLESALTDQLPHESESSICAAAYRRQGREAVTDV